jgi:L-threonylcarbamoyladenylate synthase
MFATTIGKNIDKALQFLEDGELVGMPTETVYGLAADALQTDAVLKIYTTKGRPSFNPLILHVASLEDITKYTSSDNALAMQLAEQFMPGPLSILMPRNINLIPDIVCAGLPTVAMRIPNNAVAQQLLKAYNKPLCAPSANKSGYVSPTSAKHVLSELQGKIPYILDGGLCGVGVESTIVECIDNQIWLHREGGISAAAIEKAVGKKINIAIPHHAQPKTSGQLKSHYATVTPLYQGKVGALMLKHTGKKIAVISFYQLYDGATTFPLSKEKNIDEAAKNLFATLRILDAEDYDIILAEIFPSEGIGAAINDRLFRAQVVMKKD